MAKLHFPPAATGYSAQPRSGVLAVELDGGSARYRIDVLHNPHRVRATWFCNQKQYDYLNAFYRTATSSGALPFDVRLRLDKEAAADYSAHFVPGTFGMTRMEGRLRVVEAELEVLKPFDPEEEEDDEETIAAYEASRGISA